MKNIQKTSTRKVVKAAKASSVKNVKNVSVNVNVRRAVVSARNLLEALRALRQWLASSEGRGGLMLLASLTAMYAVGWLCGCDHGSLSEAFAAVVVTGAAGAGKHVADEPLTLTNVADAAPGLLRNEIDERIVKIRPMSTPLDQISRYGGARRSGSMKVEYYAVDTTPGTAKVSRLYTAGDAAELDDCAPATISTSNNRIFSPSTTVVVPSVTASSGGALVLYVQSVADSGVKFVSVNHLISGKHLVPSLSVNTQLVRMGRAAAELDVMTAQFEALPTKKDNYCQIFKAQVEQSTFVKIANKEVGWSFTDQEEAAIIDMRLGMEKSFLFGSKSRLNVAPDGSEVMFTGGIWNQTNHQATLATSPTEADLVKLCKEAFTNNAGSTRKILLAGSTLIERLNCIEHSRILAATQAVTKWGLDFTEVHSKFGTLYVLLSEVFDQCGMAAYGMVIDPEYLTKYCHVPFRTERLNLRQAGVRNTDAIVITEASCLVLRYPQAHTKVVPAS